MNKLPNDLDKTLQDSISKFCREVLTIIHKSNTRVICIVIQLHSEKLYIGSNIRGRFIKKFYDETKTNNEKELKEYVELNNGCIQECRNKIDEIYPHNKLRSFNILYNGGNRKVNVCLNRIGSRGINESRLFNEFIDTHIN